MVTSYFMNTLLLWVYLHAYGKTSNLVAITLTMKARLEAAETRPQYYDILSKDLSKTCYPSHFVLVKV